MIKKILYLLNILLLVATLYILTRPLPGEDYVLEETKTGLGERERASAGKERGALRELESEDYQDIIDSDLFGTMAEQEERRRREEREEPEESAEPAEPLELNLLGTVAGGSRLARAIIQAEGETRQGVYSEGDSIKRAEIKEISRKRVLLARDGTHYELTMDMTQVVEIDGQEAVLSMDEFRDAVSSGESGVIEVDRAEMLERGGGMFAMMRQVQENLRAEPYVKDGEALGLKLKGVEDIGVAKLAGVEEGDVVRSVNDQAISSVSEAMRVFRRARHLDDVSVKLLRNGEEVEMSYKFK